MKSLIPFDYIYIKNQTWFEFDKTWKKFNLAKIWADYNLTKEKISKAKVSP